eukprot:7353174-Prymnesium_polylepis.2
MPFIQQAAAARAANSRTRQPPRRPPRGRPLPQRLQAVWSGGASARVRVLRRAGRGGQARVPLCVRLGLADGGRHGRARLHSRGRPRQGVCM